MRKEARPELSRALGQCHLELWGGGQSSGVRQGLHHRRPEGVHVTAEPPQRSPGVAVRWPQRGEAVGQGGGWAVVDHVYMAVPVGAGPPHGGRRQAVVCRGGGAEEDLV